MFLLASRFFVLTLTELVVNYFVLFTGSWGYSKTLNIFTRGGLITSTVVVFVVLVLVVVVLGVVF